jgi:carboxyl-terminal processing protease
MEIKKRVRKIWHNKQFLGLLATLLLCFNALLAACGLQSSDINSSGGDNTPVALSPIQITKNANTAALQTQTTTNITITTTGNITSTPVVITTNTNNSTAEALTPTNTSSEGNFVSPTSGPSPTPTLEGSLDKVDPDYELKIIKTAYDDLQKHLFKTPDNPTLLSAALKETATITNQPMPDISFEGSVEEEWNKFSTAFNKIVDNAGVANFTYPKGQLAHRAIGVMADTINDEHTSFMSKDEYTQRNKLLQGDNSNVGFGIVFTVDSNNVLYIVRIIPGSPADKAGLKAGDQIIKFDGENATPQSKNTIRASESGSTHTFIIKRPGQTQPLTINATKGSYTMPTVEYRMINNHIGYIAIRNFFTNVASETDKAMGELYKQGADCWIFDVRDDPGGVDAEQVAGRFIKGGEIIGYNNSRNESQPDKSTNEGVTGPDSGKPFSVQLPLVLLVNEGSASSSEIFALVIHDFNLGTIVGDKTAGALGHTAAYPLGDGTAVTITVDEYVSAKQEKLNGLGLTPDVVVPISMSDLANNRDPQLVAAVNEVEKNVAAKAGSH